MAKGIGKLAKKTEKKLHKKSKRLSKQMFGKKSLTLKHTYDSIYSVYGNGKEKKPYFTLRASGEYKISVFKLIAIILCVLSTAALVILFVKAVADKCRERREGKLLEADVYPVSDDGIPF